MGAAQLSIRDALALFADHNEAAGKSPKTIRWYGDMMKPFAAWMEQRGTPNVSALSVMAVEAFLVEQRRHKTLFDTNPYIPTKAASLSSHSIHAYVRALRALATWLHDADYLQENVPTGLKPPKTHKAVVDTLTDEEIEKLLRAIDRASAIGLRDCALITTYLDTGARCDELLTLKLEDAHLEEGWLLLDGKGNKERMVRIGATAKAALRQWQKQGRPVMAGETSPFLFVDGHAGGKLSVTAVERRIRNIASAALPGRRVYCHLFRHTFATNFLVYGLGDELHLMATLGHTTLMMVRHYVDKAKFLKALKERQGSVMDTLAGSRPRGRPAKNGVALWSARRAG